MKTWITSDLHWGHKNMWAKFCPDTRPWDDTDKMNEDMITMWNETIAPDDLVYILGDVAFMKANQATEVMRRLNGRKILVEGNHDKKLLQDATFRGMFEEIHKYLDINHNGTKVIMFHYPICEWDQMHRGSVHFHGHLHGSKSGMENFRCRDMGFDATGKIAVLLDDAIEDAKKGEIKGHH